MALYALNLFDLADNESYRQYSRRSAGAVGKHGGRVVALGRLDGVQVGEPDVVPRTVMILVEWPSDEAFRAFLDDPEHADLHQLREEGTRNYLWWLYERLEDLIRFPDKCSLLLGCIRPPVVVRTVPDSFGLLA